MAKRVPLQSVVVMRGGKRVIPEIGKPFEFEKDEIEQIEAASPGILSKNASVVLSDGDQKPLSGNDDDGTFTGQAGDNKPENAVTGKTAAAKTSAKGTGKGDTGTSTSDL